jgi:GH15 family glucan-1,4-alpha-glucosidase
MGEFEGAFLPATFMMATAYAKADDPESAERILKMVESISSETGLIAEELDARNMDFLGNTPLIFSLVEYVRAVMELAKARPLSKVALMAGMMKHKLLTTFRVGR